LYGLKACIGPKPNTNTPSDKINLINKKCYEFLWGPQNKIKQSTAIGKIQNGGLNMIDIESFLHSTRSRWIERLINNPNDNWSFLPNCYIKSIGLDLALPFMQSAQCLERYFIPEFYKNCIDSYCQINKTAENKIVDQRTLLNQCIWGNPNFKNKNNMLFFPAWVKQNIIFLKDLCFTNTSISERFIVNKITCKSNLWCEMLQLKTSLKPYANFIRSHSPLTQNVDQQFSFLTSKQAYMKLIESKFVIPTAENKWESLVSENLDFRNIYTHKIFKMKDKTLAEFNFKLLHNILPNRKFLFKCKKVNNENCLSCGEIEDTFHILMNCKHIKPLLKKIMNTLNIEFSIIGQFFNSYDTKTQWILTLLHYISFKNWVLVQNNKNKYNNITTFFKSELSRKNVLYRYNNYDVCEIIENLLTVI
jgi:hypothetical protein